MAQALICDSCEQPIVDRNNRLEVIIVTSAPIADPRLDLCADCGEDVINSTKVKRGCTKAMEKIENWMPPVERDNPTGDPVAEYTPQLGDSDAPVSE